MSNPKRLETRYLNLINQICKLLNSSGDLMRNMNMVLIMLQEYLPIRNPCLLIRDTVINKYFIDLAPEISEDDKNRWNKKTASGKGMPGLFMQHQMVLSPDEPDYLDLPCSEEVSQNHIARIIRPVTYQQQHLPLCIFSVMVTQSDQLNEVDKIIRFISDMLAVSMIARGFPVSLIQDSAIEENEIPRIIDNIIGQSENMKKLAEIVKKVAASKATVMIHGESGTGKELLAKAIHNNCLHRKAPFIGINCAALSENLLESELFGHEKGSFTGATGARKGRFEMADGGTLFLDEIGDTSLGFQTKILRVLQEGQFERLGGNRTINVDVRIVCATNINLELAVQNGTFREDLYYRLHVVKLELPPLRDRRSDIPLLVNYFIDNLNQESNSQIKIRPDDMKALESMNWPGNIRELENAIHSAFLMEKNNYLHFEKQLSSSFSVKEPSSPRQETAHSKVTPVRNGIESEEIEMIVKALEHSRGIQKKAAEILGISLRQLRYRIKKYDIIVRKLKHN